MAAPLIPIVTAIGGFARAREERRAAEEIRKAEEARERAAEAGSPLAFLQDMEPTQMVLLGAAVLIGLLLIFRAGSGGGG